MIFENFKRARLAVLSESVVTEGVGGLGEKAVHKILKLTIEPDVTKHEVKYLGSIADIKNDDGIYEIQTRHPENLSKKLEKLLPECKVTLVIPLIKEKRIRWINTQTGEISEPRKSPKSEDAYTAINQLHPIAKFFTHPNFRLKLIFLSADEYKRLDGWDKTKKKGATRIERIPSELLSVIDFNSVSDYERYIPSEISGEFLAKDFARAIKRPSRFTYFVIRFFVNLGLVAPIGKEGRAIKYMRKGT